MDAKDRRTATGEGSYFDIRIHMDSPMKSAGPNARVLTKSQAACLMVLRNPGFSQRRIAAARPQENGGGPSQARGVGPRQTKRLETVVRHQNRRDLRLRNRRRSARQERPAGWARRTAPTRPGGSVATRHQIRAARTQRPTSARFAGSAEERLRPRTRVGVLPRESRA